MAQHMADVNLVPIIMQGRDQSNFVPANVEDGKFSTWSAWGKTSRSLAKFATRLFRMIPY
jgi:hypothetical protein